MRQLDPTEIYSDRYVAEDDDMIGYEDLYFAEAIRCPILIIEEAAVRYEASLRIAIINDWLLASR